MPYNANDNELEILKYWQERGIFEKSVKNRPENKPYVFYDGPPFATGLPHYGHIVASLMKDVVPRYFTMRGYRVERVWGWDCHGLPIENIVEKELGAKSKKDIEAMGVAKFNELCRSKMLGYVEDWGKTIHRLGRWVDMEHAYRTMDRDYMESVWWVFKELWDRGLIYEDYRSMHICPRCETTLSQQEVSEGYKDVKDISLYVKFKLINAKEKLGIGGDVYMLAWTTTPWTLPGNVLLAVGATIDYVIVQAQAPTDNAHYILAKERFEAMKGSFPHIVIREMAGQDIVALGLEYESLFPYYKDTKNAFRVVAGDFVSTEEGAGIVHIAPAFGDEDFKVGKREEIPLVQHVGMDGRFKSEVTDFAGQEVKPKDGHTRTDVEIIKWLGDPGRNKQYNKIFQKQKIEHSYPHCWRCDTPLLNYATSSWFVKVTAVKERAMELAKQINWSPEHIKEGRFGKWLEGARDWSISRQRFWASVMPVWQCGMCKEYCAFGSVGELEKASGQAVSDLHKHIVDGITFVCGCGGIMKRIPDVLDTWFDSASMPYAQAHYPFENKKKFEEGFPAEFIGEGQDQTRAWFYYLHALGTALFDSIAFKNVIVNGIVLAEDGKKMSKKLNNYPDPNILLEKYGADALRMYLLNSPVMRAENLNFSEEGVREVYNKALNTLSNVLEFYRLYANEESGIANHESGNILDRWIVAKLNILVREVTEHMNAYCLTEASRPIGDFITELSQWYVRRSRERFKGENEPDKQAALATLCEVLLTLAKVIAPFTPFFAEKIYQELRIKNQESGSWLESVHLEQWPEVSEKVIDDVVIIDMEKARKIVELGLALRAEAGIKVRQPLSQLSIVNCQLSNELKQIIADELNVRKVIFDAEETADTWRVKEDGGIRVALDIVVTDELKKEGLLRELVRAVNQLRKEQMLTPKDEVVLRYDTRDSDLLELFASYSSQIASAARARTVEPGAEEGAVLDIDGREIRISLEK